MAMLCTIFQLRGYCPRLLPLRPESISKGGYPEPGPAGRWIMTAFHTGGAALGQRGHRAGRERQARGPRHQRPEAPQEPTWLMKTKARVSLKIPLFPRFPSRLLLWPHMFPMSPHSNEFQPTNNLIQLFGGREFLRDEVMVWLQ